MRADSTISNPQNAKELSRTIRRDTLLAKQNFIQRNGRSKVRGQYLRAVSKESYKIQAALKERELVQLMS